MRNEELDREMIQEANCYFSLVQVECMRVLQPLVQAGPGVADWGGTSDPGGRSGRAMFTLDGRCCPLVTRVEEQHVPRVSHLPPTPQPHITTLYNITNNIHLTIWIPTFIVLNIYRYEHD